MKIVCTQENLKIGLQIVSRTIGTSQTLPILNNVLLKTEDGQLKLIGTNLELAISTLVRCKIEQEGSISVQAKTLTDLVNNLPNSNITIELKGLEMEVSTDKYSAKLKTLPPEEFPLIPVIENGDNFSCPAGLLKKGINSVYFATSNSESQPEISGVLIKIGVDKIKLVATDRYRLAEKVVQLPMTNKSSVGVIENGSNSEGKSIILPQKAAIELSRLIGNLDEDLNISITNNQISVIAGDTQIISRLIDGQYPEYSKIIPESYNATVLVEKKNFTNALKTMGIFSQGTGSVSLKYDIETQTIGVSAVSSDIGNGIAEMNSEVTGESGNIMLNYKYVLDFLNTIDSEMITIKLVNEDAPVIFITQDDKSYLYLIMPIKG